VPEPSRRRDHVARLHDERGDVDDPAVDAEVTVRDELAGLLAAHRQVEAIHDVVEAPLERLKEDLTGLSGDALSFAEVALELRLEHAVVAAHLLLLTQLAAVFRDLLTGLGVLRLLTGRGAAALDRALAREAAVALEEELDLFAGFRGGGFAAAQTAHRSGITSHIFL
jgi:hypothetical protein